MSWIGRTIRRQIRKYHFRTTQKDRLKDLRNLLEEIGEARGSLTFVQIGGNDGVKSDPIHHAVIKFGWRGIILEPQKMVFEERLTRNYAGIKNVVLENKAIAQQTGARPLYKIAFSEARWATGLASFDKDTIIKHIHNGHIAKHAHKEGVPLPSKEDDYITQERVETITVQDLLKSHELDTVDLFHIDTEGFDYEILKMIDFGKTQPDYVYFEHQHLSIADWNEALKLLKSHGFDYFLDKTDTFAYKKQALPSTPTGP